MMMGNDKMREALEAAAQVISDPNSPISDTLWASDSETLQDMTTAALTQQPESEPVAWMVDEQNQIGGLSTRLHWARNGSIPPSFGSNHKPLYTSPQPSPRPNSEPVAWAAFTVNGLIRIWSAKKTKAHELAEAIGQELLPLYLPGAVKESLTAHVPAPLPELDPVEAHKRGEIVSQDRRMLTSAPSIAEEPEWISCEDRLPTESDADYRGQVWFCTNVTAPALVDQAGFGLGQIAPHVYWMPTGLVRPRPPVDGGEE